MEGKEFIYIVTQGSYSSYNILAVFKTEDEAGQFVALFKDDYDMPRIEPWPTGDPSYIYETMHLFQYGMDKDGQLTWCTPETENDGTREDHITKGKCFSGYTLAYSPEHVAKIANEKRVQLIERGEL